MALTWNWSDKVGTWTTPQGQKYNLYCGNAYLIVLHEHEDLYDLVTFWADAEHMKNCLGLSSGYDNIYQDWDGSIVELDGTKCPHHTKIANALIRAFNNITVKIHH